jgi:hypothetical protein
VFRGGSFIKSRPTVFVVFITGRQTETKGLLCSGDKGSLQRRGGRAQAPRGVAAAAAAGRRRGGSASAGRRRAAAALLPAARRWEAGTALGARSWAWVATRGAFAVFGQLVMMRGSQTSLLKQNDGSQEGTRMCEGISGAEHGLQAVPVRSNKDSWPIARSYCSVAYGIKT